MRKALSPPFANFVLSVVFIGLFFVVPKLLAGIVDPVIPMVICVFGFFIFGRRLVNGFR